MTTHPLPHAATLSKAKFILWLEKQINAAGCEIKSRGTLKKYPGCIHWHITMPGQKGTLEATYLPDKKESWIGWHENRYGEWMEEVVKKVLNVG